MANSASMTTREAIRALQKRGYSKRRIARELGIHRKTVGNYLAEGPPEGSKCTTPTPGSGALMEGAGSEAEGSKFTHLVAESLVSIDGKVVSAVSYPEFVEALYARKQFPQPVNHWAQLGAKGLSAA